MGHLNFPVLAAGAARAGAVSDRVAAAVALPLSRDCGGGSVEARVGSGNPASAVAYGAIPAVRLLCGFGRNL